MSEADLLQVLVRLRAALVATELPLAAVDAPAGRQTRDAILSELDDHLISRLVEADAPLLVVVGGSTGAGKSTLVNSILGTSVTAAGVLRPTTRSPVLVHHPDDGRWFGADRLLPSLTRSSVPSGDPRAIQLVALEAVPAGMAIVDAPDVDSVEEGNRAVATQLLAAADLWLFVTSAARYADQVPWQHLRDAATRGTAVALVLDRTEPDVIREVGSHLIRMLESRGLRGAPLFMVPECTLDADGRLPDRHAREVREWLYAIAAHEETRTAVVRASVEKGVRLLPERIDLLVSALRTQERLVSLLDDEVAAAYGPAMTSIDPTAQAVSVVAAAVDSAWADFAGTLGYGTLGHGTLGDGTLGNGSGEKVGRRQRRLRAARAGQPGRVLTQAVSSALVARVVDTVEHAAEQAAAGWAGVPAGAALLDGAVDPLGRAAPTLRQHAHAEVQLWLAHVRELVDGLGTDGSGRTGGTGLGAAGAAALLALATLAGPPSGGVSRPAAELESETERARVLLDDAVGPDVASPLVQQAALDLRHRLRRLVDADRARYSAALEATGVRPDGASRLQHLSYQVADLRAAGQRA